jgi:hypothetical protein
LIAVQYARFRIVAAQGRPTSCAREGKTSSSACSPIVARDPGSSLTTSPRSSLVHCRVRASPTCYSLLVLLLRGTLKVTKVVLRTQAFGGLARLSDHSSPSPGTKLHSAPNHRRKSKFPTRAPRQGHFILSGLACASCWFGRPCTFLRSIAIAAQVNIAS